MALATETQRRSMFGHGVLPLVVHPLADGTIEAIDRKHFLALMATIATQVGLQTDYLHIFSETVVEPVHIADSGNNVLVAGDVELQGGAYIAGVVKSEAGRIKNTSRYTTTQTIPVTDDQVFCNTDGGAWTATLSPGVEGQTLRIINSGTSGNILTLAPDGAELLIGVNSSITIDDSEAIIITYNSTDGWL